MNGSEIVRSSHEKVSLSLASLASLSLCFHATSPRCVSALLNGVRHSLQSTNLSHTLVSLTLRSLFSLSSLSLCLSPGLYLCRSPLALSLLSQLSQLALFLSVSVCRFSLSIDSLFLSPSVDHCLDLLRSVWLSGCLTRHCVLCLDIPVSLSLCVSLCAFIFLAALSVSVSFGFSHSFSAALSEFEVSVLTVSSSL